MNYAKEIIIPKVKKVFRTVFLYVGQGESILLLVPDGQSWKYMLVDTNTDIERGGIDIPKLLKDLLDGGLDIFVNTHPHNDHLKGLKEIDASVPIKQVWHSGHKPGKDHDESYQELIKVMKRVGDENVFLLKGSREENKLDDKNYSLGDVGFNILAPAEYVTDEIEDEKPEDRYNRIHEQCAVIKFFYGTERKCILLTGDSDKIAWQKHITDYHAERLPADVLSASHHGSNTFFKNGDEDPYEEHIKKIKPSHLVISAPKRSESPHGHPDEEAIKIYKKYIDDDNIYHLGKNRECVIVDIYDDGDLDVIIDKDLVEHYGLKKEDDNDKHSVSRVGAVTSRMDRKPMGIYEMV
jgi:competence protein ComEC